MNRFAMCPLLILGLVLGLVGLPSNALAYEVGDICTLEKIVELRNGPKKKSKKRYLQPGVQLVIVKVLKRQALVRLGKRDGYLGQRPLNKACSWKESEPKTPAVASPPAPAPEPTPEPASVPPTSAPPEAAALPSPASVPAQLPSEQAREAVAQLELVKASIVAAPKPSLAPKSSRSETLPKLAVMDLKGGSAGLPEDFLLSLSKVVSREAEATRGFEVISWQDIVQMLGFEGQKQALGCNEEMSCLAEIGGALGVDYVSYGSVMKVGDTFVIQMELVDMNSARNVGRVLREYDGSPKGLYDEVATASRLLVRDVLSLRSGALVLTVSEEGATIKVDERTVGTSPMETLTLAGGMHEIEVEKEGFIVQKKDVQVEPRGETVLHLSLIPSQDFLNAYREEARSARMLAWTGIGLGAAGLLAGGGLWFYADSKADALTTEITAHNASEDLNTAEAVDFDERRTEIGQQRVIATWSGVGGVVTVGVGLLLHLFSDDPGHYDAPESAELANTPSTWRVTLDVGARGLAVVGKFP